MSFENGASPCVHGRLLGEDCPGCDVVIYRGDIAIEERYLKRDKKLLAKALAKCKAEGIDPDAKKKEIDR